MMGSGKTTSHRGCSLTAVTWYGQRQRFLVLALVGVALKYWRDAAGLPTLLLVALIIEALGRRSP